MEKTRKVISFIMAIMVLFSGTVLVNAQDQSKKIVLQGVTYNSTLEETDTNVCFEIEQLAHMDNKLLLKGIINKK